MLAFSNISVNSHLVVAYLCRESKSLISITKEAVESLINALNSPYKKFRNLKTAPKRIYSFNKQITFKFNSSDSHSTPKTVEMSRDKMFENAQKLFLQISDFLFESSRTLNDVIHTHIFYKTIDG
jgi:hypothetical protein